MNISTLTKKEYEQDQIQTRITEIFSPEKYIAQKTQNSLFADIKSNLREVIENIISPKIENNVSSKLNEKFLDLDFGSEFEIDATKIGVNDAIFFVNLLNQENIINYSIQDDKLTIKDSNNKTIEATNSLLNMLKTSLDSNKPIRLDFENDVTVILKLDKEGKIQAHFIPGTSEAESYLKQNIPCLRKTFENENINYSSIEYSKYKENKNSKRQKRNNK